MTRSLVHGSRLAMQLGTITMTLSLLHCSADVTTPVGHEPAALRTAADAWTSRDIWSLRNVGWASHRNISGAELQRVSDEHSVAGMIPLNLSALVQSGYTQYSSVWRDNVDGRDYRMHWDLTSEQYAALWDQYGNEGFRPLNVTSYLAGDQQLWAGIWIENREGLRWSSYRGLTGDEYAARFDELSSKNFRPIDIDGYDTSSGLRYATIWYENVENVEWAQLRNMSHDSYVTQVNQRAAAGYMMIDDDRYSGDKHAAIWERPVSGGASTLSTTLGEHDFANFSRQNRDEGLRPLLVEAHDNDESASIWVQNYDRYQYDRKGQIDAATRAYLNANSLPGISVAVIRGGDVLYQHGFGWADVNDEKAANAETVYNAASVSKVFGGTLAARLEDTHALMDGTAVSLDLKQPTALYLPFIPAQHAHTVEQVTAHLGCIPHYDTTPAIANQTTHYDSAGNAVQSIWNTGLVVGCNIGATRSYSTAGFTFVGAVLEAVSGRTVQDLVATEIAQPFGLGSLRAQWADGFLTDNYERATPYDSMNNETSYEDSSWKVFGGGLELNVVDLARFGQLVLSAQIVSPTVRDTRLFSPVAPGCAGSTAGICKNGVAWELGTSSGRSIVEHDGSWTGARSLVRIYPNDNLVVAVMSNRTDHDPKALGTSIGDIVLAP